MLSTLLKTAKKSYNHKSINVRYLLNLEKFKYLSYIQYLIKIFTNQEREADIDSFGGEHTEMELSLPSKSFSKVQLNHKLKIIYQVYVIYVKLTKNFKILIPLLKELIFHNYQLLQCRISKLNHPLTIELMYLANYHL